MRLRASYDAVADAYASRFGGELEHKPLDRALLDLFAADAGVGGVVGDVGCGPGHISAYLHSAGLRPIGIDLSPRMVELARRLHRGPEFVVGSMLALPAEDASWSGLVAFYSIIHLATAEVWRALAEFRRVLRPGAPMLLAFHVGDVVRHVDTFLGQRVDLDFHLLRPARVRKLLREAGFSIEMSLQRAAYISVEAPTQRGYILARAVRG